MFCLRTFKGFMNEIKGGEYFEFSCIFVGIFYCSSWCLSPCGRSVTSRPGRSTWSCPWTRPGCPGSHQHQRDSLHTHTTLYTTTAITTTSTTHGKTVKKGRIHKINNNSNHNLWIPLLVRLSSMRMWTFLTETWRFLKMLAISFWTNVSPPPPLSSLLVSIKRIWGFWGLLAEIRRARRPWDTVLWERIWTP